MKKIILVSLLPFSILYASEDTTPTPRATSPSTFSTPTQEQGTFTTGITIQQRAALKEYYKAAQNNVQVEAKTFIPFLVAPKEDSHAKNISRVTNAMNTIIARVTPITDVKNVVLFGQYEKSLKSIQKRIKQDEANLEKYTNESLALRKLELELYKEYELKLNAAVDSFSKKLLLASVY